MLCGLATHTTAGCAPNIQKDFSKEGVSYCRKRSVLEKTTLLSCVSRHGSYFHSQEIAGEGNQRRGTKYAVVGLAHNRREKLTPLDYFFAWWLCSLMRYFI